MKGKNPMEINEEVTIIGNGVVIEGKLQSNGNVRIDGKVQGDVSAKANVTVGEKGEIFGQINAEIVTIGGRVDGSVSGKEKVVLESKAQLKGDLTTKILVVEAGARFDGNSSMSGIEKPKIPEINSRL